MKRNRKGVLQRDFNGRVVLTLPIETVKKKLKEYDAISFEQANGKEIEAKIPVTFNSYATTRYISPIQLGNTWVL